MRTLLGVAFAVLSCCGVARGACGTGAPAAYEDVDRLLLIRCQVVSDSYPCFRLSLTLDGQQIRAGSLNVLEGIGVRGTFVLASSTAATPPRRDSELAQELFFLLRYYDPVDMTLRPFSAREIDGPLNVLGIRRCGKITILRSIYGIDDADHTGWSSLLQRLQSLALNLHWNLDSPKPDIAEASRWFDGPALPSFLDY
jgi:hypothetical protein